MAVQLRKLQELQNYLQSIGVEKTLVAAVDGSLLFLGFGAHGNWEEFIREAVRLENKGRENKKVRDLPAWTELGLLFCNGQ